MPLNTRNNGYKSDNQGTFKCGDDSLFQQRIGEGELSEKLRSLPKIKAAPDFEQKLAAKMSLELEQETARRNRSLIRKNKSISIPYPVLRFTK